MFAANLNIDARRSAIVTVVGELDSETSSVLARKIAVAFAAEPRRLRIDLSGVTSCDSQGLRTLVGAYELCQREGVACEAVGATQFLVQMFGTADCSDVFDDTQRSRSA